MLATINNSPVKELLKKEIQQYLQVELDNFHNLLLGSLARVSCLEKEIDELKRQAEAPTPGAQSSTSSTTSSPYRPRSSSSAKISLKFSKKKV